MPGGFLINGSICNDSEAGGNTSTTAGTLVTIGSGSYGSWTQISAGCPVDCVAILSSCSFKAVSTFGCIWRIGVGASGSEQVIAAGLRLSSWEGSGGGDNYCPAFFPLSIPAGMPISVSAKGNSGDVAKCKLNFFQGSFEFDGVAGYDEIGVAANVLPSTTAHTKGSYVQIGSNTSRDYAGLFVGVDAHQTGGVYMIDLAIGTGGSQIPIINNVMFHDIGGRGPWYIYIPIEIPSGTAIWVRCQGAGTSYPKFDGIYAAGAYR